MKLAIALALIAGIGTATMLTVTAPSRCTFAARWEPVHQMTRTADGIWRYGPRRSEAACSWVSGCITT